MGNVAAKKDQNAPRIFAQKIGPYSMELKRRSAQPLSAPQTMVAFPHAPPWIVIAIPLRMHARRDAMPHSENAIGRIAARRQSSDVKTASTNVTTKQMEKRKKNANGKGKKN